MIQNAPRLPLTLPTPIPSPTYNTLSQVVTTQMLFFPLATFYSLL